MFWLLLAPLPLAAFAATDVAGVHPDLLSRYTPSSSDKWTCLDGSKEIPWAFVNDDSCDCPDGSDEPGTGACPDTWFYCKNDGHIGSSIPSSRVRDGLCEALCCDGSDERPGTCPNTCAAVGKAYRQQQAEILKVRKTGAKIRSTYISYAEKEKKRLEATIETTAAELAARQKEVARLQEIADATESLSAADLEHKKDSPLFQNLLDHHDALKSLQREHKKLKEREKTLAQILDTLRRSYNPNYQDMAVLDAVRGWEFLAGLPHINDVGKDAADDKTETKEKEEVLADDEWSAADLEKELPKLLKTDYVGLLLEHDEHIQLPPPSPLFELVNYLPDSIVSQYEDAKDMVVGWMESLGMVRTVADDKAPKQANKAQIALNEAKGSLRKAEKDNQTAEKDLSELFNPEVYGAQGEWKKLDQVCLEKDLGDYTYEVCLFGQAKQKPKKGGTTFNLGKFKSWNNDASVGSPEYYSKQQYTKGTKCWNGPERSLEVVFSCGTENAILSIAELEKCQYRFTATSPALCLPVGKDEEASFREEL
ncbi:hypothetical protein CYLTODRAFT_403178 [Cylindrobasidium torrendii FP15055 ss-10]|uniref:Glucosidase 2 subunit beta n=1 Tax=Cylindrobasidium torrendii FP15055 ss-10 TaxID=1314674 RepID=A0A0D7AZZ2_9AGAR|nr:hypothetical protein CYLTODRAFT_403178 [Cylindrobasidium torrendii FP15055 ss-10]